MDWLYAESLNDLKKYKTLTNLKRVVSKDIKELFKDKTFKDKNTVEIINIKSSSWKGMYDKIVTFRTIVNELNSSDSEIINNNSNTEYSGAFKSKVDEYIFYLLELDGKVRADKLNITRGCYSSKKEAKAWRDNIAKVIHPDKCKDYRANDAYIKLNDIYEEMLGYE